MIDRQLFTQEWSILEERFQRTHDVSVVRRYYEALNPLLDDDHFSAAARALFFSATFFPKPGDFLSIHAEHEWIEVLKCIDEFVPPEWCWAERWERLSARSQAACQSLGGIPGMKRALGQSLVGLRKAFFTAYEGAAAQEVAKLLPAGPSTIGRIQP